MITGLFSFNLNDIITRNYSTLLALRALKISSLSTFFFWDDQTGAIGLRKL